MENPVGRARARERGERGENRDAGLSRVHLRYMHVHVCYQVKAGKFIDHPASEFFHIHKWIGGTQTRLALRDGDAGGASLDMYFTSTHVLVGVERESQRRVFGTSEHTVFM